MEKLYYANIGDGEVVVSGVEILVRKIRPILLMQKLEYVTKPSTPSPKEHQEAGRERVEGVNPCSVVLAAVLPARVLQCGSCIYEDELAVVFYSLFFGYI